MQTLKLIFSKRVFRVLSWLVMSLSLLPQMGYAAIGVYEFESESQRDRFQLLVHELRCPKCQNQTLSDSNSQIAIDLRDEVARMVKEDLSNSEVNEYMVNRYGDFVLYRPPVQTNTLVLWWGPVVMLGLGALIFVSIILRRRKSVITNAENSDVNVLKAAQESSDGDQKEVT